MAKNSKWVSGKIGYKYDTWRVQTANHCSHGIKRRAVSCNKKHSPYHSLPRRKDCFCWIIGTSENWYRQQKRNAKTLRNRSWISTWTPRQVDALEGGLSHTRTEFNSAIIREPRWNLKSRKNRRNLEICQLHQVVDETWNMMQPWRFELDTTWFTWNEI